MTIFDFTCDFYFREGYATFLMVEYLKKKNQITQKEINEKMNIPKSNFRRAQQKEFVGYTKLIEKMAGYFKIPVDIDKSVIDDLNEQFSQFYTCICFSKIHEAKAYFDNMVANFSSYDNTILIVPYYLAQLIYYVSDINYTNKVNFAKIEEAVTVLEWFVEKMSTEHRFLYYEYMTSYNGIIKNHENVVHFARLTLYMAANFPDLEPTANYHVSFSYSMVGDFINALIYANKALPKLEEQLNYQKAVFCRMNIAALYKKLGNVDEAKRMLKKNLIYLNFNDIPRLDTVTYLNYADCMLMEDKFQDALKYYEKIEKASVKKPEYESVLIVYCLYKLKEMDRATEYIETLNALYAEDKFPIAYLSLIQFFKAYFEKGTATEIIRRYKAAQEHMAQYRLRGQYIQDIAQEMYERTQSIKAAAKGNKIIDSSAYVNLM